MNDRERFHLAELIEQYFDGSISDADFETLEKALLESKGAKQLYLSLGFQHNELDQIKDNLIQDEIQRNVSPRRAKSSSRWMAAVAMVAALPIAALFGVYFSHPKPVAKLVSTEHASWSESSVPTEQNSKLVPGRIKLNSGIATIQFVSGAEMILEGPTHLELISPMKARILDGNAMVEVPEEAIGFIVDTPSGYAVDHGTAFSVSVDEKTSASTFEVLSGEISVHHKKTGDSTFLYDNDAAAVSPSELVDNLAHSEIRNSDDSEREEKVIIKAGKKTAAVVKNNNRKRFTRREFLRVGQGLKGKDWVFRSAIAFEHPRNTATGEGKVEKAAIRLNLVPNPMGSASRLPKTSTFTIYAIPASQTLPVDWHQKELLWEELPELSQCQIVGRFEIDRGQSSGSFVVRGQKLIDFINQYPGDELRFIVARNNKGLYSDALTHAFASDRHRKAAGPVLELVYSE